MQFKTFHWHSRVGLGALQLMAMLGEILRTVFIFIVFWILQFGSVFNELFIPLALLVYHINIANVVCPPLVIYIQGTLLE